MPVAVLDNPESEPVFLPGITIHKALSTEAQCLQVRCAQAVCLVRGVLDSPVVSRDVARTVPAPQPRDARLARRLSRAANISAKPFSSAPKMAPTTIRKSLCMAQHSCELRAAGAAAPSSRHAHQTPIRLLESLKNSHPRQHERSTDPCSLRACSDRLFCGEHHKSVAKKHTTSSSLLGCVQHVAKGCGTWMETPRCLHHGTTRA